MYEKLSESWKAKTLLITQFGGYGWLADFFARNASYIPVTLTVRLGLSWWSKHMLDVELMTMQISKVIASMTHELAAMTENNSVKVKRAKSSGQRNRRCYKIFFLLG